MVLVEEGIITLHYILFIYSRIHYTVNLFIHSFQTMIQNLNTIFLSIQILKQKIN